VLLYELRTKRRSHPYNWVLPSWGCVDHLLAEEQLYHMLAPAYIGVNYRFDAKVKSSQIRVQWNSRAMPTSELNPDIWYLIIDLVSSIVNLIRCSRLLAIVCPSSELIKERISTTCVWFPKDSIP
jgi:hypothetical protein